MSDRELLELAAKAYGISGEWVENFGSVDYYYCGLPAGLLYERPNGGYSVWNPLEDDGDALRLAERCSLTVCMNGTGTVSACDEYRKDDVFATQSIHECGGSRITATRRAIVRAAAEIGRAMP